MKKIFLALVSLTLCGCGSNSAGNSNGMTFRSDSLTMSNFSSYLTITGTNNTDNYATNELVFNGSLSYAKYQDVVLTVSMNGSASKHSDMVFTETVKLNLGGYGRISGQYVNFKVTAVSGTVDYCF